MKKDAWSDQQVEQIIGRLLQSGVLLSAAVVLLGGILYLAQPRGMETNYQTFEEQRYAFPGFSTIIEGAAHFDGRWVIELGLLLLIATPVARVAFSVVAFGEERDWAYVIFTCIVLAILLYSLSGIKL